MSSRAVLYGINRYKSISHLRGCVKDVENIESLLIDEFGFTPKNVRTRTDHEVTLDRIERDWKWLTKGAKPGDKLVFHFSGHGSYVKDKDGDEGDGVDELLCLYDMDFDDSRTYLVDDQIYEFTKSIPPGVKFTFLLDCCHSGSGTRQLVARSLAAGEKVSGEALPIIIDSDTAQRASLPEMKEVTSRRARRRDDEKQLEASTVLARFIEPPANAFQKRRQRGVRKAIGQRSTKRMNHVTFTGCRDDQTSADAYIDGEYQGAFSHSFCDSIRSAGADIAQDELLKKIRASLKSGRFSQVPQLEPTGTSTSVFDGLRSESDGEPATDKNRETTGDVARLITKVEELLSAIQAGPLGSPSNSGSNRNSKRSIVYVHGICQHSAGFSDSWFAALSPHLTPALRRQLDDNRHEVLWSDHVTSRSFSTEVRSAEGRDLENEIKDVLKDRVDQSLELQMQHGQSGRALNEKELDRALLGIPGLDCVDDFLKYLLNRELRQRVIDEFHQVVRPLLRRGDQIEVISHSWGTVVALEALHQLDAESSNGNVRSLFTVGSALSIRPVQRRLSYGAETGRKPSLVDQWINIDARGDVVGGTLRSFPFDVDHEDLNLEPTGCSSSFFGVSPACAHRSYFVEENTIVNHHIFANRINH